MTRYSPNFAPKTNGECWSQQAPTSTELSVSFTEATTPEVPKPQKKNRRPPPFSLRLNAEERARLEQAAGDVPLGTFIKCKVLDQDLPLRRRRSHAPVKDHAALAQVLGMLGQMRFANNLNQIAKGANMGTLPLTPEVEAEVQAACAALLAMKAELMRALGYPAAKS